MGINEDVYEVAQQRFVQRVGTDLKDIFAKFRPMNNYQECEPVFRSVARENTYYNEAQFCLGMCEVADYVLHPKGGLDEDIKPTTYRKINDAIKHISEEKSVEDYEIFLMQAVLNYFDEMSHRVYKVTTDIYNQIAEQNRELNMQMQQLLNAGVPQSQWRQQANQKTEQLNSLDAKMTSIFNNYVVFQTKILTAFAENMKDPDHVSDDAVKLLLGLADGYEQVSNHATDGLKKKISIIIERNRSKARRFAAAEERKKKAAEEKRKAEAQKKAVEAWWEQHPDRKTELETKVKEVRAAIKELDREEAKWKNVKYEIDNQLKKPTSAENELRYRKGKRTAAAKKLETIRAITIEATPSEKLLSYTESAIASKKSVKALLSESNGSTTTGDQSIVNSDDRLKELSDLEKELANLGILSWGKKRRLSEQIAQRKNEILSELEREIAPLEDKVLELEAKAKEERAAEEARLAKEEHDAEIVLEEASSAEKEAELAAGESRKSLQEELGPRYREAEKAIREIKNKKMSEQNNLKAAESELKNPRMS